MAVEGSGPPHEAAIEATREIGLAVLATTLSLVAVFLPVGLISGLTWDASWARSASPWPPPS